MSFFTNNNNGNNCPGAISGNPMNGICERACIQVEKLFDSCLSQTELTDVTLTLTGENPSNPTTPLTFISAVTDSASSTTVSNLTITRFDDKPNFARVQGTANVPVTVTYTDDNSVMGTASATVTQDFDVILYVPQPSVVPFTVEAVGSFVAQSGTYNTDDGTFTVEGCLLLILKVMCEVDLLVPSYGYCSIPECQAYTCDMCPGVNNLPIYPTC